MDKYLLPTAPGQTSVQVLNKQNQLTPKVANWKQIFISLFKLAPYLVWKNQKAKNNESEALSRKDQAQWSFSTFKKIK